MSTNRQIDVRVFSAFRDPVKAAWVRRVARAALAIADEGGDRTVSIVIADDDTLHDLNRRFRGLDEVTDVLSFGDTGEGGSGYEVPAFAGTTEPSAPTPPPDHPHPNLLPSREKGSEPRGNDEDARASPDHPHPNLLPSREKGLSLAGTTGTPAPTPSPDHPHPNLLPSREKGPEPRGNDEDARAYPSPDHPHPDLLPSREKGSEPRGNDEDARAYSSPDHPHPNLLPSREKGSEPRGNDEDARAYSSPDHPHPNLLPSREKGSEPEVVFPSLPDEPASLGEVVLSYPLAIRQADEHNVAVEDEAALLIVHGVLHLLGHDHAEPGEEAAMKALERAALDSLKPSARSRRQSDGR